VIRWIERGEIGSQDLEDVAEFGEEHRVVRALGGPYYQHLSNGGATDPNPAVDALGFTVGLGWTH
jgi:Lipid A 3-O-deacylase (PagL)